MPITLARSLERGSHEGDCCTTRRNPAPRLTEHGACRADARCWGRGDAGHCERGDIYQALRQRLGTFATVSRRVALTAKFVTGSGRLIAGRTVRLERLRRLMATRQESGHELVRQGRRSGPACPRHALSVPLFGSTKYRRSVSSTRLIGGYTAPSHSWSGSGTQVIGPFTLESGLAVFDLASGPTDSNFIVELLDANGRQVELLANEIGYFSGSKATNIPATTKYFLEIDADTTWSIRARQPRALSAPATIHGPGTGPSASGLFSLSKRAYKFTWRYTGDSNFVVLLLDRNGRWVDLIVNEIGSTSGSALVAVPAGSLYVLDVDAAGPWSVTCQAR